MTIAYYGTAQELILSVTDEINASRDENSFVQLYKTTSISMIDQDNIENEFLPLGSKIQLLLVQQNNVMMI